MFSSRDLSSEMHMFHSAY